MDDSANRQLLSASSRQKRAEDDDVEDLVQAKAAATPGKSTRIGEPVADGPAAASPSAATPRVDRRAEPAHGDIDDGALATAFGFIRDAADGPTLPPELARRLGTELRVDVGQVRIHTDASAAKAAATLNARAFTIGSDIYFAAGAYDPSSDAGIQLIAHEMAHVAENLRGTSGTTKPVSHPDDQHERRADEFARGFGTKKHSSRFESTDPAELVEHVRSEGQRLHLPFIAELEEHFGTSLDFVETYTGDAAELACRVLEAGAFAVRNVVALADPSPHRETLMHELTHVMQMGGRAAAAPKKFSRGSLAVGASGSEVEHEAAHHTARPSLSADRNTIHREPQKPAKTATPEKADPKKLASFCETQAPVNADKSKLHWGAKEGAYATTRYYEASNAPFGADAFVTGGGTKEMLETAVKGSGTMADVAGFRVHQAPGGYIISRGTTVPYVATVVRLTLQDEDNWKDWTTKILVGTRKVDFPWGGKFDQSDPPTSATELDTYRDKMRTAVATKYANKEGRFGGFYKDFVKTNPHFTNKITGSIFEELVALSASKPGAVKGLISSSNVTPVWDTDGPNATDQVKEVLGEMGKQRLDGDGVMTLTIAGSTIAIGESKAYTKMGPVAKDRTKMGQYKILIDNKVPGYVNQGGAVTPVTFNHASYTVACPDPVVDPASKDKTPKFAPDVSAALGKWMDALGTAFGEKAKPSPNAGGGKGGKYSAGQWSLHPPPSGEFEFKIKFNPELSWTVPADTKSINLDNPSVTVPGLQVKKVQASLDDSKQVTSGSVNFGIDAADLKKAPETKPLTPAKGGAGGQVDNKVTGLTSKLAQYLPVDIDAAIVDDGVEATIKLKQGAAKGLAGFEVEAAEIKATYKGGGTLTVDAEIGLKHKNGKISGSVKVAYDNGWSFEGKVKISDGFIPGVAAFEASVSKTASGEWKIGADSITIEKQFGGIKLTGTGTSIEYNVKSGMFKGELALNADLGMFGKASGAAKIVDNKLTQGSLAYDSPEFKYPAKSDKPGFAGTVGGTVKFNDGKFSGDIRGTANINIPALKKVAGEDGAGLAVDAHIGEDGSYSGTIKTTTPLKFGKHLEVPSVSCTLNKDGSVTGSFEIKVVKLKYLETARVKCTVSKEGIELEEADFSVAFGSQDKGKFWGTLTAGYKKDKGLTIGGEVNYKIKDDMVATGTLKYSTETHAVSLDLTVKEIVVIDKKISKQLFKASKQIPVVNVYGLGIYIDIGLDLGFDFGFKITTTPKVALEGLSLETWEFTKLGAKLKVGGDIYAQLTGTPKLGIGVFALDPSILRGGGGLKVPIVGRLDIKPDAEFGLDYTSGGGVSGSAKLGLAGNFGITGSVKPYAEFSVLNDMWNPKWEGEALAAFEILKPKELFNFTVDLAGDSKKDEAPALPEQNSAKEAGTPTGDKTATAKAAAPTERGGDGNKSQPAKQGEVAEGGDEGPFSLSALMGKLKGMPGFATAEKIFKYAKKIWAVVKPIYDIVEPLMDLIAKRIEAIIDLFDTEAPTGSNLGPWLWKLAKKLFNIGFGGLGDLASAIRTLLGQAAGFAKKLINKAVQDGHIGVKRHSYYIWMPWPKDDIEFMAAAEYKVNIPGIADLGHDGPPGFLLTPGGAVSLVLYEALGAVGVGYTYRGNSDINQPYNDIWTGSGARG